MAALRVRRVLRRVRAQVISVQVNRVPRVISVPRVIAARLGTTPHPGRPASPQAGRDDGRRHRHVLRFELREMPFVRGPPQIKPAPAAVAVREHRGQDIRDSVPPQETAPLRAIHGPQATNRKADRSFPGSGAPPNSWSWKQYDPGNPPNRRVAGSSQISGIPVPPRAGLPLAIGTSGRRLPPKAAGRRSGPAEAGGRGSEPRRNGSGK
jgi:hypothetical protein